MEVYRLDFRYHEGYRERSSELPDTYRVIFRKTPPLSDRIGFTYHYLSLASNRFEDVELVVHEKRSDVRYDVESCGLQGTFLVSQKFKDVCAREKLPMDFFPVLSDGERWHIMMWRSAPVLGDYEMDVDASKYTKTDALDIPALDLTSKQLTFSKQFLEHRNITGVLSFQHPSFLVFTESIKNILDDSRLEYGIHRQYPVSDKLVTEREMEVAIKNQQTLHLAQWKYEKKKKTYEYLEQILLAEGDKGVIEKFNVEIKSKWEDQFIRFANGTLPPDERVKVW